MATLTFAYAGKCPADHVYFDVRINGVKRAAIVTTQTELKTVRGTEEDAERFGMLLISTFCRKWWRDNPTGTLAQLRTALEAQEWVI